MACVVVAGCRGPDPAQAVARIEAAFPVLAEFEVTGLYRTGDCDYLVYRRGAFVSDPLDPDCDIDVDGPRDRKPFDPQAAADLDALLRPVRDLRSAFPEYSADGAIIGGLFGLEVCPLYAYAPGAAEEALGPGESPVSRDWLRVECPD